MQKKRLFSQRSCWLKLFLFLLVSYCKLVIFYLLTADSHIYNLLGFVYFPNKFNYLAKE